MLSRKSNNLDISTLKYAIENDMLNMEFVQSQVEMAKRQSILEKHPYEIWKGVYTNKTYYCTYLPDVNKGRVLRKRNSMEEIEQVIIDYWKSQEMNTFKDRYQIWIDRQEQCGRSGNTIYKYEYDYKRFFEGDPIENESIQNITDEYLAEYIMRLLSHKKISWKALRSLFGYLRGIFNKAVIDKVIPTNPCSFIDLGMYKKYCTEVTIKTTEERILSDEERLDTLNRIKARQERYPYRLAKYAVELALYTGMRAGELAGLMWKYVDFDRGIIKICYSEKFDRKKKEYYIKSTKNDLIRIIPITDEAREVLLKVQNIQKEKNWISEFVFANGDGRIHVRAISDAGRNFTMDYTTSKSKSIHAIRRTVNSNMSCAGVPVTIRSSLLGHTEKVNNENYTYDVSSMEMKEEYMKKATRIVSDV